MNRLVTSLSTAVLAVIATTPAFAVAPPPTADRGLPNIDRRAAAPAAVPARTRAARSSLENSLGPLADVRTERAGGAVSYVGRATGLLTGPSPADPRTIALDYVRDHGEVFGLTKGDFDNLVLVARDVSPEGITHLRFNQVLDAIQSFDSGLEAHVTRDGRLINVSGAPLPGATLATTTPALSALAGLGAARQATRGSGLPPRQAAVRPGASRITTFTTGERAQLRWSASADGPVLAWQAITDGGDGHMYDVLVDAGDGALLRRQDLTNQLAGEARHFPRDPDATPVAQQITMPPAWYDDSAGGTRLWGQYARTYVDPTDFDPVGGGESNGALTQVPASGGAPAAPEWLYTQSHAFPGATPCPVSGCTWDSATAGSWTTNQMQAATNLHVLNSRFHDHLAQAPIGFDEASGNFQRTDTSGQGLGNDYVRSEVDDGVTKVTPGPTLNNANMATPPDGQAARMQMFLFDRFDVNGSDTADIVYHEYGHGLSNRLVVNAAGSSTLGSIQARMMGEAWSDFYATDLLVAEGSMTDTPGVANLTTGEYAVGPGGVRRKPIDCPVNPAGVPSCDRNGTATTVLGGYTYGDIAVTNNATPHNGGEIWAETLWDLRTAVGRVPALALITGAMRISADNPSMLDMRDAILQQAIAMRSAPGAGDDLYDEVWPVFQARGMGASATTPSASAMTATEAFDAPRGLRARGTTLRDPYPGGDNDGQVEPGERFFVDQSLEGIGLADLPGVNANMAPNGGAVTVEDGTAAWPLLGKGRRAVNGDPLVARLPSGSCASAALAIDVTSAEGGAFVNAVVDPRPSSSTVVALADATGTPVTPIPQSVDATFTVPSGGAITDVDLRIDELRHTFLGDLEIRLIHDGVTVLITDNFANVNFDGDDIVGAIFDDAAAALPVNTGPGPVTGVARPAGLLSAFNTRPAAGVWTLRITDTDPGDSGELRRWGLTSPQVLCPRAEIPAAATGDASGVDVASGTLGGSVTPNGRATGLRFSYGTTTAYGTSTAVQDVGAGDAAVAGTAALTGLELSTTYHFRVEAIREGGAVAVTGADATFTTGPPPPPPPPDPPPDPPPPPPPESAPPDVVKPVFVGRVSVRLTPGTVRGRRRATFSLRLSEAASVKIVLTRSARGVRRRARCVTPLPLRGRRCTRQVAAGTTTRSLTKSGAGVVALSAAGLRKGSYTATLVATDAAKNASLPRKLRFTVR